MVQDSCNLSCSDISINTGGDVYVNGTVDDEVQLKREEHRKCLITIGMSWSVFRKTKRINFIDSNNADPTYFHIRC